MRRAPLASPRPAVQLAAVGLVAIAALFLLYKISAILRGPDPPEPFEPAPAFNLLSDSKLAYAASSVPAGTSANPLPCESEKTILLKYSQKLAGPPPSDIHEHMPFLRSLAADPKIKTILEIGIRHVYSSWAFAAGAVDRAKLGIPIIRYTAADITKTDKVDFFINAMKQCTGGVLEAGFIEGDDLVTPYPESDLLFIDTWHVYRQLIRELHVLSPLAREIIVLHDTTSFATSDERPSGHGGKPINNTLYVGVSKKQGLWTAVQDFLAADSRWRLRVRFTNNNGLTVLERVSA